MYGDLGGGTVDKIVTGFLCTIPEIKGFQYCIWNKEIKGGAWND